MRASHIIGGFDSSHMPADFSSESASTFFALDFTGEDSSPTEVVSVLADEEVIDLGTDQVVVLNEYQDEVVIGKVEPEADDEDDDERELVCRH